MTTTDRAAAAAKELGEYLAVLRAPQLASTETTRQAVRAANRALLLASQQAATWAREGSEARFETTDLLVRAKLEAVLRQHTGLSGAIDAAVNALRHVADILGEHDLAAAELERTVANPEGLVVRLNGEGLPAPHVSHTREAAFPQIAATFGLSVEELLERAAAHAEILDRAAVQEKLVTEGKK